MLLHKRYLLSTVSSVAPQLKDTIISPEPCGAVLLCSVYALPFNNTMFDAKAPSLTPVILRRAGASHGRSPSVVRYLAVIHWTTV